MANENETNINLAEKYSDAVDERFKLASITNSAINNNYDFDGVNTISVYSVDTAELNDYNRRASSNRYGTPSELGNAIQTLTLSQDKGFTFTIDRGNYDDSVMASSAGNALQREIDEVITPTVDKYRLSKICSGAGAVIEQEITSDNAYTMFLDATTILTENLVPVQNRIAFVTPNFYKCLKLDKNFVGSADRVNDIATAGIVTKIDNVSIIVAPTSYLPENVNFIITHPSATLGPVKLAEYKTHENPQGISGWLCEGRIYFDAFVLNNKKKAIVVSKEPETQSEIQK